MQYEDRDHIGKYMFSIANGNHILRYTEVEYRDYLASNPEKICYMLILHHASHNWGYDDPRMAQNYDEQWLAQKVDPSFQSSLSFDLKDFTYDNLLPYQKIMIDFTQHLIEEVTDLSLWLKTGSRLETVYEVLGNTIEVDIQSQEVLNKEVAIRKALEMARRIAPTA